MARLYEFQGKQLLKQAKVSIPRGEVAVTPQEAAKTPSSTDWRPKNSKQKSDEHEVRRMQISKENFPGDFSGPYDLGYLVIFPVGTPSFFIRLRNVLG